MDCRCFLNVVYLYLPILHKIKPKPKYECTKKNLLPLYCKILKCYLLFIYVYIIIKKAVYCTIPTLLFQFTERALAHELLSPMGGATAHYHIALARVKLQKRELEEAEESLNEALQFDYQVQGFLKMLRKFRVDGSSA